MTSPTGPESPFSPGAQQPRTGLLDSLARHYDDERAAAEKAGDTRTDDQRGFDESAGKHARDLEHSRLHGAGVCSCHS